jgi:D-threo-aldose 1-dehydrogenase
MPLPTVTLGVDGIATTPLGFGCASLFRVSSRTHRSALLYAAYESGLRHFDVAPMYGLGRAERELGAFARPRRAELSIATKFGIRPTLAARSIGYAQGPVRRVFAARPGLRGQARAHAAAPSRRLYEHGGFHAAGARRSLERSLRALRTDYIDLFLLHDPMPGTVRSDEVSACLEQARAAGLIRSWGLAGDLEPTSEVARSFRGDVPVRQFRDDIFLRSLQGRCRPARAAFVTFGVLDQALPRIVRHVSADEPRRLRWKRTVGADCGDPDTVASFLLRAALRDNGSDVVLFGSTRPSRIRSAANTVAQAQEDPALDVFLCMVDAELIQLPDPESPERERS